MSSREEMLAEEHRKAKEGKGDKYNYVDVKALERDGVLRYKLEEGDHFIRVITPRFQGIDPLPMYYKEVWIHSNVGPDERVFLCNRKMKGEPCPVCEYLDHLQKSDPENPALKSLYASRRYLFFVYNVRNNETESKGLHWLDAPISVKDSIVAISRDRRSQKFLDVSTREEGKDIEFERIGKSYDTKYQGFILKDNGIPPQSWYDNAPNDFDSYLRFFSYEEIAKEVSDLTPVSKPAPAAPAAPAAPVTETRQAAVQAPAVETRQAAPVTETRQVAPVTETRQVAPVTNPAPAMETRQAAPAVQTGTVEDKAAAIRQRVQQITEANRQG